MVPHFERGVLCIERMKLFRTLVALMAFMGNARGEGAPLLRIGLHDPCNIFEAGQSVRFPVEISGLGGGRSTLHALVRDYFGREVCRTSMPLEQRGGRVNIDLGELENGYYNLAVWMESGGKDTPAENSSFGVAPLSTRSANEALQEKRRFGLKMGGYSGKFEAYKVMRVAAQLGLHWTRETFDWNIDRLSQLPVNIIYKVEKFPVEAYDEARYGPRESFRLREFRWNKATVPLEKPYKRWLKEKINALPADAGLFEIWNEAWGKLPPTDFAKVAQWTKDAIREIRPTAKVGPNLGVLNYDAEFIEAGGMEGMNVLFLHPYGHPERSDLRARLRKIRDFYSERGYPVDIYVTEFGVTTPPKGPYAGNTEEKQARLAVRSALAFYAEDVKAFTAHWLGQLEKDPEDREHWFGYFRANSQPKPVLLAMGTAARLIDGSEYVGDLFLKPDVGARLFKRNGVRTLVLWTNDCKIPVELDLGVAAVESVNIVGRSECLTTVDGRLSMELSGDPVYLVGVGPELEEKAVVDLWEEQWRTGRFVRGKRQAHRMKNPPVIDGHLEDHEWKDQTTIPLGIARTNDADIRGTGFVAWDATNLYVAAVVEDDDPFVNTQPPFTAYLGDSVEVFVGSDVKYQIPEFIHTHDRHMIFSPTSSDGRPVSGVFNRNEQRLNGIRGLRMASVRTADGWSMEVAIPLDSFKDFPATPGHLAAFEMRVNDVDSDRRNNRALRVKMDPVDGGRPDHLDATVWSTLQLVE